jgi:hypothetical protein
MAIDKARHAFGNSANLESALQSGAIDAYDILFLDGDTEPKVGWVDKNGVIRIVEDKAQIIRVEELPTSDGDESVVYVYNNEGYIWDSVNGQCVPIAKSADLTTLETQVTELTTQMEQKVDATTVQSMIEEHYESAYEIIEF